MSKDLGRNDRCWCGSGKKFKLCHWGREQAERIPLGAMEHEARQLWNNRVCLHPEASTQVCNGIVRAHSLHRAGLLSAIVNPQNHVGTFYPIRRSADGRLEPREVGWREASVFTGFCGYHDSAAFRELETKPFEFSARQCFLLSYRAACHEVHQKIGAMKVNPFFREHLDRGRNVDLQHGIQRFLSAHGSGVAAGLRDMSNAKLQMDSSLLSGDLSAFRWRVFVFDGEVSIASTGGVSPNIDLSGNVLQILHDLEAFQMPMFYGMAAVEGGLALVFGWRRNHDAPLRFLDSVMELPRERISSVLAQFIFAYVENTYFATAWWDSLPDKARDVVTAHAGQPNSYYTPPVYTELPIVPWVLREVRDISDG